MAVSKGHKGDLREYQVVIWHDSRVIGTQFCCAAVVDEKGAEDARGGMLKDCILFAFAARPDGAICCLFADSGDLPVSVGIEHFIN